MIVADSSPLIVLGRLNRLDILATLFGQVHIPTAVYQEVVVGTKLERQREAIVTAIAQKVILVAEPTTVYSFQRKLDAGEIGVLSLALERSAQRIILDDRKARNEARALGLGLLYTTDILKGAERRQLIASYADTVAQLRAMKIYLPE